MRKYLLLIIGLSFALSSLMGQSSALPTGANNDMPVIVNDSLMFIGQHVDSLTEEQRYFNPIYLIVQKGKEYLKNQLIHASVCDCDTTIPNRRIGIFSVAPNKYVSFSQGNLQYFPAANLWKFADNQYEHLGASNKYLSPTYRNWLDLFGWSSDSGKAPFGVSTSIDVADYKGDFVDWGSNWICGDPPSTWRTLSKQEWEYLIQERPMASSLYGMAQVIGINGIVLLPDKWLAPEGITFIPGGHTNDGIGYFSQHQSFSVEQWRLLEESGAVFLPAAGIFISPNHFITAIEEGAHYYTSNQYDEDNAYWFGFRSSYYTINYNKKHMRRSVRLVHDTIISFEPEYVDLGLSVKWATCNVGATKPEEYGNYFAWGETDSKEVYDWSSYLWCNGTEESINKYNTTDRLTTLLPEDDAAHVNWGEEWRMPTDKEWTELRENCIWTQTMQSGINGYKVTGINGNSIFLPAAGFHYANGLSYTNSHGDYWSSSRNAVNLNGALHIYFEPNSVNRSNSYRYYGFPIRPVYVDHTLSEPITPTSRIGVFSVSQNKQVSFAQGDLQYIQSEEKWRFADTQYEFTGKRHFQNGQLNDTIMYFGWSGKGSNAPWGISLSVEQKDYEGVFLDWGTNRISEYAPNTWRTISNDELNFLCKERKNAELLIGLGKIGDIGGLILLPDDWTLPQNLHFKPLTNDYTANQYTLQEWTEMESAGAIFLSMSGYFNHKLDNMRFVGSQGFIKTNTLLNERQVYSLFKPNNILYSYQGNNTGNLYYAFPVRLIRDTIPPPPAPCQTFEVNGVTFNMMCVEGGTFVMGATDSDTSAQDDERPQHQVALSNFMIGQTEVTQELWTAVMGSNPSKNKGTLLPVEQVNWEDCEIFITRLNQLTGRNFRLPTEAEWEYAARGGQKSHGFIYAGSDNLDEVAWYDGNSSNKTHNVGTKLPNELGIYDMSGNVYERCYDWYAPYTAEAQVNPKGPTSAQTYRTVRGGGAEQSAYGNSIVCRVLNRGFSTPKSRESYIGLRLVLDEHEYVDLGLSVMWATTNVGAESAEEYGDYFAWGETETKEVYDWSTYKWCDGTENNMTKYNATDDLITLLPEDDAAHVNWGGKWRMPTDAELQELIDNCTWKWDEINGTEGYYVTSNINNNHIFIPASGYKIGGGTSSINRNCQYWSNTLCNDLHAFVYHAYKSGSHVKKCTGSNRSAGQSVRPVLPTDREILAPATPAKRIGVFSVEKDKQVSFSQGNLQYVQYRDEWRFAENQYDYIGAGNVKNGALADKIDLFGWSGEDNNAPYGISTSTNNADYAGEFVDWGSNVIQGDTANTWRTLSKGELEYLIKGRKNASNLRAAAQVNGVNGMVLLPDDWECPEGIDFKAGYHTSKGSEYYAEYQQFTKEQWRELETTGAIFLPAAGMHDGNGIADIQAGGYYWSATDNGDTYAYTLISQSSGAYLTYDNRYDVRSVRLVHDTIVPPPAPCQTFEVNGVSFNMMCVEGGTFTWGEGSASQQVTVDNYMIGQTEVTQALWKVVMGTTPEDEYDSSTSGDAALQVGDSLPMAYMSWNDAQMFLERLSELTGLAFRLPTEIEWVYAAKGGKRSKGYKFAGSDILQEVAWCGTNSKGEIKQVGQLRANELGTYDMSGNVWEFCSDVLSDGKIVAHGGSSSKAWSETHLKPEYRYLLAKGYKANRLGIRLALDTAAYKVPAPASPGKRIGVFSVAKDKQVSFSQGNLQYTQSKNQWRFAENQYDYIGEENVKNGALADKIDLFGWSGESSNAPFGVSTSTNIADYQGTFVDWSTIVIQGDTANTWRTLSKDEWVYLIEDRKNAPLLYGVARVNGVNGMVLLPDADYWICPMGITFQHGLTAMDGSDYYRQHNDYTLEQWMQMEAAGAVFFPAMGIRVGTEYKSNEYAASIWTSTPISNNTHAYLFNFHSNQINISNTAGDFYSGRSVRLVHDTIVPPPAPCQTFEVNGVSFNMMCVEGGTFMMGAAEDAPDARADEKPQHQVTVSDFMIAQTEVTQELWTAVMGNNPSHFSGNNLPVDAASWNDCQAFIAKLNELTSLHFRLPTEAEWEFAARGGNHSRGYKYAGSDNIDEVAWYDGNSSNTPHEVGTKLPNELGLFDMSGNVWEFCQDWYSNTYYTAEAQTNPTGPTSGTHRVDRGGSWFRSATHCRIPYRDSSRPTVNDYRLGLRLVLDKHEYVDLGLSVMWATTNVGAESAEEYGDYFAWGETTPKEEYNTTTYQYYDRSTGQYTKYGSDSLTMLEPEDDAAHVNWGGEWRMPTKEEMNELIDKCTWTWTQYNGIDGYEVTGTNSNSIFLPAAGYKGSGGPSYPAGEYGLYWLKNELNVAHNYFADLLFFKSETSIKLGHDGARRFGFTIRPVLPTNRDSVPDDDKVTVTIHATPSDASISLFCSGYTKEGNKITVDKGKSVLYQVSNVENCYLSQGDSLLNMTKDTTLYINLKSFSDGTWETIDNSTMKHTPNCYISRNNCRFAQYQNWEFYVMPATKGEIYRIRTIAGQHAAPWIAVSNPPDLATLTYATQVACSPNKGMAAYIAEEFVVPEGTNYLIINYRKSNSHPLIIERKVTDIQPIDTNSYTLVLGNDYNPLFCDSTDRASIMPYTIFIPKGVTIAPKPGYRWGYYTDVDTLNMPSGKLQYAWTTDSYVGEGKPVGITIKKDSGVFDFSSDSRYATDYFYTSDPSIWIKSSSED